MSKVAENRADTEASLRSLNEELDKRVMERTEELRRANEVLRERETRLLEQTDDLQRSNTDLAYFAYVASHDMQEPLRMIGIYAELLRRRHSYNLDRDAQQLLAIVVNGADRLQRLVADLLRYANVARGPAETNEVADMNAAVRVSMENIAQSITESGARIEVGHMPAVPCDAAQISQVFQNLLTNAIKYRSQSPVEIVVAAELQEGEWVFTVRDNGIGIKTEYHHSVFAPFKRLHGQDVPGSGIGLAICRRIVERHGGRIWVESDGGPGSSFKFSLPARQNAGAAGA